MAVLDLDKIIQVSGWGGWGMYPWGEDPAPYPIISQHLGLFHKPNAWDTDSNGWMGLLDNNNNQINAQNQNFKDQMAVAPVSWTGPLSTRIKSYDFSANIDSVNSGKIKYSLNTEAGAYLSLDLNYTTKDLENPTTQPYDVGGGYIVTNEFNGKKYLFSGEYYYELDWNYNIVPWSQVSFPYETLTNTYDSSRTITINKLVGSYDNEIIRRGSASVWGTNGNWYTMRVIHYKFNSGTWILETVFDSWDKNLSDFRTYGSHITWIDNMLVYNTSSSSSNWGHAIVYSFANRNFPINKIIDDEWYTRDIYQRDWTKVWRRYMLSGGWQSNMYGSWVLSDQEHILTDSALMTSVDLWYSFITLNNWQSIKDWTQKTDMVAIKANDGLYIKWGKVQCKWTPSVAVRYELDWVNQPDDCIKKVIVTNAIYGDVDLKVNGQSAYNEHLLASNGYTDTITLSQINSINSPHLEVELEYTPDVQTTFKNELTLWATGWAYWAPTIPASNWLTGDASTKRQQTNDSSDIYLTLW